MYTPSIVTTHRTCKRASRHSSMSPLIDEPILMGGAALATTPHVPTPPLLSLTRHHRSGQAAVAPSAPTPHPRRMSQQSAVAGRRRPGFRVSSPVKERIGSNCGARNTPRHRMPPIPKAQRSPGQQYVRVLRCARRRAFRISLSLDSHRPATALSKAVAPAEALVLLCFSSRASAAACRIGFLLFEKFGILKNACAHTRNNAVLRVIIVVHARGVQCLCFLNSDS